MENQFSEGLTTGDPKRKFNLILLIITILICIILIVAIVILSIKLANKSRELEDLKNKYDTQEKTLNDLSAQYKNQNRTLNDIFNLFQNLILKTEITHPEIKKEDYKNVTEKVVSAKGLNDGTYDFVTMEPLNFEKGYSVAFETLSRNSENYYSEEEYNNIVYKLSALLGSNANIGVYGENPHISYYVEDKNISLSIAALFNQQSVWDWSIGNIILNTFHQPEFY